MKNHYRFLTVFVVLISLFLLTVPAAAQSPTPTPSANELQHGDKFILGDTFRLKFGEVLNGNLVVVGGTVTIDKGAQVNGDIVLTGGTMTISGSIQGSIVAIGGVVNLNSTAVVNGDLSSIGASVKRDPNAQISGKVTEQAPIQLDLNDNGSMPAKAAPSLLEKILAITFESLALAALAVVLALIFPAQIKRAADTMKKEFWVSGGVGLITVIGIPIVLVVMTITIILIPVMIFAVLALALTLIYGWVIIGYEIGDRLSQLIKVTWPTPVSAGIGVMILSLVIGFIGLIPCVGWIIGFLVILLALGAIVISRYGSTKYALSQTHTVLNSQQPPVPPTGPQPPVMNG